jgi:hypothetical protein
MMRPNRIGWFIVALFLIGGATLWIWIPDVWIGQIWVVVALGLAGYYLFMNRRADRAEKLQREGIPGEARILEMTQTGMYINEQPRVRLKLLIQAPGVPEFEAEDTYTVPLIALGALTSGHTLQVYLDRAHPTKFAIDWFGGGGPGGGPPPAVLSAFGSPQIDLNANPDARDAILEALRTHGIDAEGTVDLRQEPAARAAVLDALERYGIDVAHGVAAAAPATSVEPPATPLDRLQKLTELRDSGLITDKEFEQQKARIIDSI